MPGLGLMDGCVKHTPLDLGWDDCSVGLLTGCQGGYTEHTDSAFFMHVGAAVCAALTQ